MGVFNNVQDYMARSLLALRAGLTFNGARDLYAIFGYNRSPTHADFVARYLRQGIATRIINAPVDATWTDKPTLKLGTEPWAAWDALTKETKLYTYIRMADIFAGLGTFSILMIGFDDGLQLDRPVVKKPGRKITYLQPYMQASVEIIEFDVDTASPRFGRPVMYRVSPGSSLIKVNDTSTKYQKRDSFNVHWSRVVHFAENTLENRVFGHSRLETVYNDLDDILKVGGGAAETYWITANRGLQVNVDKDIELNEDDADALSDEIDEYVHNLRRVIRTRGVDVKELGSKIADAKNTFFVLLSLISAATGIPQRVLIGAEAGQLASQQDRANWADRIEERIANYAEPFVLLPTIETCVNAGVIEAPTNLVIEWPDPFKMNPLERAQTSAQIARSAVNVTRAMATAQDVGLPIMSIEEARTVIAPGNRIPILVGTAEGTVPPEFSPVKEREFEIQEGQNSSNPQDPAAESSTATE